MKNVWDEFSGINAGYVLDLYDRYLQDPNSVDAGTRAYFEQSAPPAAIEGVQLPVVAGASAGKIVGAVNLANSIREYGHLAATLNPMRDTPRGDPSLELETHGLTEDDLHQLPASLIGGPLAANAESVWDVVKQLRRIYAGTTGYSYEHIHEPQERAWLREAAESRRLHPSRDAIDPIALLRRLTRVEVFEQFLHRSFPGKTRFSVEGLDMLVPLLDEIIGDAAAAGIRNVILGMAHRGRLNVLANILNKPLRQIFAEFRDPATARDLTAREELGWTGDVKYHSGARRTNNDGAAQVAMSIIMPPNPSHLEAINPVVVGMARAEGTNVEHAIPAFNPRISLPLLIHGDAAFIGEGIVAETLNLSRLPGYQTGGTIHVIANNRLGYTTTPSDGRSTLYASDLRFRLCM